MKAFNSRIVGYCLVCASVIGYGSAIAQQKPLGLVLAGGGARGAYEIGVWKAICELGLDKRIVAISGTSVGGINAAMFGSVRYPARCERLWSETIGSAFVVHTNKVGGAIQDWLNDLDKALDDRVVKRRRSGAEAESEDFWGAAIDSGLMALDKAAVAVSNSVSGTASAKGICDPSKLRAALMRSLPAGAGGLFEASPRIYVTTLKKKNLDKVEFLLNGMYKWKAVECLMATSALPIVFDSVNIDGDEYIDGRYEAKGGDNVPIGPIRDHHQEVKTAIVVYLRSSDCIKRRLSSADFPKGRIVEIIPSRDIGGLLSVVDGSELKSSELIGLGYQDAMVALKHINW